MLTVSASKNVTLPSGIKLLLRCLEPGRQRELLEFFQGIPREDICLLTLFTARTGQFHGFRSCADFSDLLALVAQELEPGRIVGAVVFSRPAADRIGEVHFVYVARPFQKSGLGTVLLEECLRYIRCGGAAALPPLRVSALPCGAPPLDTLPRAAELTKTRRDGATLHSAGSGQTV